MPDSLHGAPQGPLGLDMHGLSLPPKSPTGPPDSGSVGQARCLQDTEHILREGPVEIGPPCPGKGEARLPSTLAPALAPGKRGMRWQ